MVAEIFVFVFFFVFLEMEVQISGSQDSLESNEVEKRKVGLLRARVESEDPSSKVPDSPFLFLPFSLSLLLTHMGTSRLGIMEILKGKWERKRPRRKLDSSSGSSCCVLYGSTSWCREKGFVL